MIDASATVKPLTGTGPVAERARLVGEDVYAPAHLDHEASRAIVRTMQRGALTEKDAGTAIADLDALEVQQIPIRWTSSCAPGSCGTAPTSATRCTSRSPRPRCAHN
ncbi:hypothetical protein [Kitasatospora griseola]|uniref:hypothetical protein n=1 Tax=Kitasatospora griseola TaxID=2064 RepID=UPI0016716C8D|nr:hypothetical protein [Kitasatospora griseola]